MIAHLSRSTRLWLLLTIAALGLLACILLGASASARNAAVNSQFAIRNSQSVAPAVPYTLCGTLSFAPPVTYTASTRPRSSTTGYLNADNNLDLVVTDYTAGTVSVFLGNADGTFQPATNYITGGTASQPVSVAIADFNEDTKPDLVVSNYNAGNVSILLGNGDGTFQSSTNFSSNNGPYGVTAGDFSEDTHLDVATSNVNFGTINVMLGNGNGSLQAPVPYPANLRPQVIATGRFNADNHLDLVVPNYTASTVSIFLGNGNGTFQPAVTQATTPFADYLTLADVNQDTMGDLVLSHYNTTNNIGVMLGNGNGTFQTENTYSTGGSNPTFASAGDFNGDTMPDLVSPGSSSDNVSILLGNGNGTFQPPAIFSLPTGSSPVSVLPGDFNHDGRLDMFTANENTNDISVFLSTCPAGTATPTVATSYTATPSIAPSSTATAMLTPTPTESGGSATSTPSSTPTPTPPSVSTASPTGSPTLTPTPCTPLGWSIVDQERPEDSDLMGVSATGPDDAWAAGSSRDDFGLNHRPLITHWDGIRWSNVFTQTDEGDYVFNDISARTSDDVWAVGKRRGPAGGPIFALTAHWDGASWSIIPSPGEGDSIELNAVAAINEDNVWAVGADDSGGSPIIMRWDGSAWTRVPITLPDYYLSDVDATGPNDVWMVGAYAKIVHWDGTSFTVTQIPPHIGFESVKAIAPNDVWVVGYDFLVCGIGCNITLPLTYHWDGLSWTEASLPLGQGTRLLNVTATGPNDVWSIGDGVALHWDGSVWSSVPVSGALNDITAVSHDELWAVGHGDPTGRCCPTTMLTKKYGELPPFADTRVGSTFYPYVLCMACRSIISGYPCGGPGEPCNSHNDPYFRPNANLTRAQLSKIVSNAAGFSEPQTEQMFQDVPVGSTFFDFIGRLASRGYISGYPCGDPSEPCMPPDNLPYFRPSNNATRGQISKVISNAAGFSEPHTEQTFQDVPVGSTFYDFIERLVSRGVMSGYQCGGAGEPCIPPQNRPYFRPNNNATRGQTSKIVSNSFFPQCQTPGVRAR